MVEPLASQSSQPNCRYGLLLLPQIHRAFSLPDQPVQFGAGAVGRVAALPDLIPKDRRSTWQDMLGWVRWDALSERRVALLVFEPTDQPNVMGAPDRKNEQRLMQLWLTFVLSEAADQAKGSAWILTGAACDDTLVDVKRTSQLNALPGPFHAGRNDFCWIGRSSGNWLEQWAGIDRAVVGLHSGGGIPRLLEQAMFSFWSAMHRDHLDFRIPDFVRAAECVVGLSRGQSGGEFANRVVRIAPWLREEVRFGRGDVQKHLKMVYQLRSDCVHGKVPFDDYRRTGDDGAREVARLELLAEVVARECILWAIQTSGTHAHMSDRQALEKAWADKAIGRPIR